MFESQIFFILRPYMYFFISCEEKSILYSLQEQAPVSSIRFSFLTVMIFLNPLSFRGFVI